MGKECIPAFAGMTGVSKVVPLRDLDTSGPLVGGGFGKMGR
jgi:hypothetical protein